MQAALVAFVLLYAGLLATWALVCAVIRQPRSAAHTGGLVLLELTVVAQAVLDVLGLTMGGRRAVELVTHVGYLVTAVLLLPLLPAVTRPRGDGPGVATRSRSEQAWSSAVVATACLALMVVEVRMVATGAPAPSR